MNLNQNSSVFVVKEHFRYLCSYFLHNDKIADIKRILNQIEFYNIRNPSVNFEMLVEKIEKSFNQDDRVDYVELWTCLHDLIINKYPFLLNQYNDLFLYIKNISSTEIKNLNNYNQAKITIDRFDLCVDDLVNFI